MISPDRLRQILDSFPKLKIGLVGDLFLDRYFDVNPDMRVTSIETGLEAYQVSTIRDSPGAMGTVMNNLTTLGVGTLLPVSVIGSDGHANDLLCKFDENNVELCHVITDAGRLTPVYLKPLKRDATGAWNELNRFDVRTCGPISTETTQQLLEHLRTVFHASDGLIVIDHVGETNWGVVNDAVRAELESLSQSEPGKLIFIDSRRNLGAFRAGSLKGNEFEVTAASDDHTEPKEAVVSLANQTRRTAWCTLGERGLLYANVGDSATHVPGFAVNGPVDIVGAGDAATAGIVATLLTGATEAEAAVVGNLTGSIAVSQLGTTGTSSPEKLLERMKDEG